MLGRYGGAIFATFSNVWITKSSFVKNVQAVFAELSTNITFISCIFENNTIPYVQITSASSCLVAESSTEVTVLNSSFINNRGVFWVSASSLKVEWSYFSHNYGEGRGAVIFSDNSVISLSRNKFTHNHAIYGGVFFCISSTLVIRIGLFNYNTAEGYGGVFYTAFSNVFITKSLFFYNSAEVAGVLSIYEGNIRINKTLFRRNGANSTNSESGVIHAMNISLEINRTSFILNEASDAGVVSLYQSNFTSINTSFQNNTSNYKGILYSENSTLTCYNIQFVYNIGKFSVMYLAESTASFSVFTFSYNIGSLLVVRSLLSFSNHNEFDLNEPAKKAVDDFLLRRAQYQGGAITTFHSTFNFHNETYFRYNRGENGGAIYSVKSTINFFDTVAVYMNEASENGGGVYLYQSDLQCYDVCYIMENNATNKGGGVYASGGSVNIVGVGHTKTDSRGREFYYSATIRVYENAAEYGGGLYLSNNAKLYFIELKDGFASRIVFTDNTAHYGGALYINDDTNFGTCRSLSHADYSPSTECFFQTLYTGREQMSYSRSLSFVFLNNFATFTGSTLHGGLLDRCSVSPFTKKFFSNQYSENSYYGLTYFKQLTKALDVDAVSSFPVRLCICVGGQPKCGYPPPTKYVKKGELFHISLVAVDQVNHTINSTVHSSLSSSEAGLEEGQLSQGTSNECTHLSFNVFSPYETEILFLYADGPCKDAGLSRTGIPIHFLPCTCPIGFQQSVREQTNCVCECDYELQNYCLLYTSPSPRDATLSRMPSSA